MTLTSQLAQNRHFCSLSKREQVDLAGMLQTQAEIGRHGCWQIRLACEAKQWTVKLSSSLHQKDQAQTETKAKEAMLPSTVAADVEAAMIYAELLLNPAVDLHTLLQNLKNFWER